MKVVHIGVLILACLCLSTGCEMANSYIAHNLDRLGRKHSTDPDAQAEWDRYASHPNNGYEPSPAAGY